MLIEREIIDRIEIVGKYRHIQIRKAIQIIDDQTGEVKATRLHRDTIEPDNDVKAASFGAEITEIANIVWTPQIRANYRSKVAAENRSN